MPLKPLWKDININFINICATKNCNRYAENDPHSVRIKDTACLANVIIDGKEDTAAIFGFECDSIPESFNAKTPAKRCYKELPIILEAINS